MATGELSNVWEKKLRSVLETSCSLPWQTYSNIRLCHICPPRTAFTHVRHSLHFIIIINYNKNCFCVFTQDTNPRKKRAQSKHRSPSIYSLATDRKCVKLKLYKLHFSFKHLGRLPKQIQTGDCTERLPWAIWRLCPSALWFHLCPYCTITVSPHKAYQLLEIQQW